MTVGAVGEDGQHGRLRLFRRAVRDELRGVAIAAAPATARSEKREYSAGRTSSVSRVAREQAADDDGGERLLHLGAGAGRERHRHETERGDQRGHDHGPEARQRAFAGSPSSGSAPSSISLRICVSITRPFSTATPDSAMKPTAAEIENGMPRSHSAAMPPVSASGTALKTSSASRGEPKRAEQQQEDQQEAAGHHEHQPLAGDREVLELAAPGQSQLPGGELDLLASTLACASATNEPMSRPRTSAVATTRRLPFSRLIWLAPSVCSNEASVAQRDRTPPAAFGFACGSGTGRFSSAAMSLRSASLSRTTIWKRRSPSKTRPGDATADRGLDHVLDASEAEAAARDLGLVDLDFQERQARGLLDLDVLRRRRRAAARRRSCRRSAASRRNRRRTP